MVDWWHCLPWCSESTQRTGQRAERAAARYLVRRGLRLVERNFATRSGEIDLIMRDGAELVFVEVRFRASDAFGDGAATVDRRKQRRLIRAALHYIARHDRHERCRFDVVSVSRPNYRLRFNWIRNAFSS
jgi:putative endonuclease